MHMNNPKVIMFISLLTVTIMLFCFTTCHAFTAVISWKTVSGSDLNGYILYESTDGVNFKKKLTLQSSATRIEIHNLSKYVNVYWCLASVDKTGNISKSSNIVKYIKYGG